jgi:hypothetical protein
MVTACVVLYRSGTRSSLEVRRPPQRGSRPMCEASGAPHGSRPPRRPPTRLPARLLTCCDHRRAWRVPGESAGRRDRTARTPQTSCSPALCAQLLVVSGDPFKTARRQSLRLGRNGGLFRVASVAVRGVRGKLRAPGLNGGGSACSPGTARSPSPAFPRPLWHWKESERRTWAQCGPNARDWPSRNACMRSGGCYIHARWRRTDRSRRSGGQGVASWKSRQPDEYASRHPT